MVTNPPSSTHSTGKMELGSIEDTEPAVSKRLLLAFDQPLMDDATFDLGSASPWHMRVRRRLQPLGY